jgi:hypothetical protein
MLGALINAGRIKNKLLASFISFLQKSFGKIVK